MWMVTDGKGGYLGRQSLNSGLTFNPLAFGYVFASEAEAAKWARDYNGTVVWIESRSDS